MSSRMKCLVIFLVIALILGLVTLVCFIVASERADNADNFRDCDASADFVVRRCQIISSSKVVSESEYVRNANNNGVSSQWCTDRYQWKFIKGTMSSSMPSTDAPTPTYQIKTRRYCPGNGERHSECQDCSEGVPKPASDWFVNEGMVECWEANFEGKPTCPYDCTNERCITLGNPADTVTQQAKKEDSRAHTFRVLGFITLALALLCVIAAFFSAAGCDGGGCQDYDKKKAIWNT